MGDGVAVLMSAPMAQLCITATCRCVGRVTLRALNVADLSETHGFSLRTEFA